MTTVAEPNVADVQAGGTVPTNAEARSEKGAPNQRRRKAGPERTSDPVSAEVRRRRSRFLIASVPAPGIQPMSAGGVVDLLSSIPDVEVLRRIEAPRILGLSSLEHSIPGVVVAQMTEEKARLLSQSGAGRFNVERDQRLTFALEPALMPARIANPGVLVPGVAGFRTTFEVRGPDGPLEGAEVHLFGSLFPAMGRTDASGKVTLDVPGEAPEDVRSLYIKPRSEHWDLWISEPMIAADEVNPVQLRPIDLNVAGGRGPRPMGWGARAMGLDRVPEHLDGTGIKIAVIDSGIAQATHRNLGHMGPGTNLVGEDEDGWTVDIIGHGSHCAGVIGGVVGETGGLWGFAPGAEIHAIRVFPGGRFSDLIAAIDYCIETGIDVASMSLGSSEGSTILGERLGQARSLGIASIVAAGNTADAVRFPASLPSTLSVAAIGQFGEFPSDSFHGQQVLGGFEGRQGFFPASFSCFGPAIDVCAPGVAVISTVPDDGFAAWDGTSMATPHVAGMAALVLAHHPDFDGQFARRDHSRVDRLFEIIRSSAIALPFGRDRVGAGLPWVPAALGIQNAGGPSVLPNSAAGGEGASQESWAALIKLLQILQK